MFQTSSTDDNGTYFELILDSTQTTIREEELLETAVPEGLTTQEGRQIQRQHLTRERDPKIVKQAKKLALTHHHRLMCEACGFAFLSSYGPHGNGYIEAHHKVPVSELDIDGGETNVADIALLCANCHRMVHRHHPWLTVEQLKSLVIKD